MSVTNSVATPGVKDGDVENQAPKDQEVVQVVGAMEGRSVEPVDETTCEKIAAVGQQRAPATYTHTTLTNDTRRTHNSPIVSKRERSLLSDAYLNARFTGTDAS